MYAALRPLLFALPPEFAHKLALAALRGYGALPASASPRGSGVELLGLTFGNRIGLAAGLDKDATATAGSAKLGFGFVEVGTVTPRPQAGNPKPRLFRLSEDRALINRMGFNSAGADTVATNLRRVRDCVDVPVGVNIGKNRDTDLTDAVDDYRTCLSTLYEVADYVVVNLSSPNTPGLRDLQAADAACTLVAELAAERQRLSVQYPGKRPVPPLFVKIAPDLAPEDLEATVSGALKAGADGIVAANTTVARPASLCSKRAAEAGGCRDSRCSPPPSTPCGEPAGRQARARLLSAWVESRENRTRKRCSRPAQTLCSCIRPWSSRVRPLCVGSRVDHSRRLV